MRVNAGQSQLSSTFVNFFKRVARTFRPFISLGKTGIRHAFGRCGKGRHISSFSLFMGLYGGRPDFRESRNVHFRQLMRKKRVYQWGLTRLP
jgi:hypothetical protein